MRFIDRFVKHMELRTSLKRPRTCSSPPTQTWTGSCPGPVVRDGLREERSSAPPTPTPRNSSPSGKIGSWGPGPRAAPQRHVHRPARKSRATTDDRRTATVQQGHRMVERGANPWGSCARAALPIHDNSCPRSPARSSATVARLAAVDRSTPLRRVNRAGRRAESRGKLGIWRHATGPHANPGLRVLHQQQHRALTIKFAHARVLARTPSRNRRGSSLDFMRNTSIPAAGRIPNFRDEDGRSLDGKAWDDS